MSDPSLFAPPGSTQSVEEGRAFTPKFDADGLVTCVATDAANGDVLMVAHMNAEALAKTIETGEAWYSAARARSPVAQGRELRPRAARRRDARRLRPGRGVDQGRAGRPGACHTGRRSCFYRAVPLGQEAGAFKLEFRDAEKTFDPSAVYAPKA